MLKQKNGAILFGIIMAGGGGTRLWPYSTDDKPKQFLDLLGTEKSLLQDMLLNLTPKSSILKISLSALSHKIKKALLSTAKKMVVSSLLKSYFLMKNQILSLIPLLQKTKMALSQIPLQEKIRFIPVTLTEILL